MRPRARTNGRSLRLETPSRPAATPAKWMCSLGDWVAECSNLKQKVSLREREHRRRLGPQDLAVRRDDVCLRIDGDGRQGVVQFHVLLSERAAAADGDEPLADPVAAR